MRLIFAELAERTLVDCHDIFVVVDLTELESVHATQLNDGVPAGQVLK